MVSDTRPCLTKTSAKVGDRGDDEVGAGVHGDMLLAGHDYGPRIRQGPLECGDGVAEKRRAITAEQEENRLLRRLARAASKR